MAAIFTILLSNASVQALDELKCRTGAASDTEVFRNALQLHLAMLRAHEGGTSVIVRRNGEGINHPVELFAEAASE